MKSLCEASVKLVALAALIFFAVMGTARAQEARIQTSQLDHLAAKASETVDVSIDEHLMQLATRFLSGEDEEEASIKEIVDGLKGIYVKRFEFDTEGQYSAADVESIRSQVRGGAWNKIVNANSKNEGGIELYLMTQAGKVSGLAMLAIDPKEITVVNIIGPIDLAKLKELEGKFGIPKLDKRTKLKGKNE